MKNCYRTNLSNSWRKTFEQLNDEELQFQPKSVKQFVIIQYLHGTMLSAGQTYLLRNGEKDWRKGDDEFEIHQSSNQQLLANGTTDGDPYRFQKKSQEYNQQMQPSTHQ